MSSYHASPEQRDVEDPGSIAMAVDSGCWEVAEEAESFWEERWAVADTTSYHSTIARHVEVVTRLEIEEAGSR